jgi:hypothetical protein
MAKSQSKKLLYLIMIDLVVQFGHQFRGGSSIHG